MTDRPNQSPVLSEGELVALLALLVSLAAMSTDAMLPALGRIGADLHVVNANDTQLIVSMQFVGLAIGQVAIGPLSDATGRRPAMYLALALFIVGSVVCLLAGNFSVLIAGRVLQGLGAAGPRVVCVAIVRDQYEGRSMAKIMSGVMAVFILVPTMAPSIGQGILMVAPWQAIFVFLLVQATIATVWFAFRQPESLPPSRRRPFSLGRIANAAAETLANRAARGYTGVAGLIFGGLIAYLSTARQLFQDVYGVGNKFAFYFGGLALTLGAASLVNGRMVLRLGMRHVCLRALIVMSVASCAFSLAAFAQHGTPPLWQLMLFLLVVFFCFGLLFGNFNALALESLGHIAGTAAAVVGSVSTLVSVACGIAIGRAFDGTVLPLVYGLAALALASLATMLWTERPSRRREQLEEPARSDNPS